MSTRRERTKLFQGFSQASDNLFNGFWKKVQPNTDLKQLNELVICPKGAMGGLDDKLIEVFFEMKYHSWSKKVGKHFDLTNQANLIYGARLEYRLTDNGYVLCILTPSRTDSFKPAEDGILLEIIKQPNKLETKAKKHWKYLLSYMRVTDVDGQASVFDCVKVSYLRYVKRCFKDGKSRPRNVANAFKSISQWVVSVGLSGLLIFITTFYINDKQENEVASQVKEVSEQLSNVLNEQRYLLESVNNVTAYLKQIVNQNSAVYSQHISSNDVELQTKQILSSINKAQVENQDKLLEALTALEKVVKNKSSEK
ncbi:hypothetical protein [Aliivibrio kagoshimensis]|uniref:hypothetical protein n=1 Tax=Aliivibrio kagoshimensis TaxID=2910230 RepID=UPI003D0B8D75